jgi:hypothetical protein
MEKKLRRNVRRYSPRVALAALGLKIRSQGLLDPVKRGLQLRQRDAALALVLAAAILVRGLANLVRFEEHNLGDALVCVDLRGQRSCVGKLERHVTFPFRFESRHVYQNAAMRRKDSCVPMLRQSGKDLFAPKKSFPLFSPSVTGPTQPG